MFQQKHNNKNFHPFQKGAWKEKKSRRNFFNRKSLPLGWSKNIRKANRQNRQRRFLFSQRGQGLIEYLILVALMGVATIGIVRTLNQTVKSRFANAIYALQGRNQKAKTHNMRKEEYQRSDLSNFMSGSASTDKKGGKNKRTGRNKK
ncbi:MAG: hypothetical protein OXJ52_05330 [Oligoflexia bacterium]|nr:hypothetical protein [Oligoflexia bacterium]